MSANKNNLGFKTNNSINSNKYEELKKVNENLILIYNEKIKENKKHKNKINYLENKNTHILKLVEKINNPQNPYISKTLEEIISKLDQEELKKICWTILQFSSSSIFVVQNFSLLFDSSISLFH